MIADHALTSAAMRDVVDRTLTDVPSAVPGPFGADELRLLGRFTLPEGPAPVAGDVPGETLPDPKDKAGLAERLRRAGAAAAPGDHEAAVAACRTIVSEDPDMLEAWVLLARELTAANRPREAASALANARRIARGRSASRR